MINYVEKFCRKNRSSRRNDLDRKKFIAIPVIFILDLATTIVRNEATILVKCLRQGFVGKFIIIIMYHINESLK